MIRTLFDWGVGVQQKEGAAGATTITTTITINATMWFSACCMLSLVNVRSQSKHVELHHNSNIPPTSSLKMIHTTFYGKLNSSKAQ